MKWWKVFVAWRLPDLKGATDDELELAARACERLALVFGIAVIAGLIVEVIEALWKLDQYPFFDRWGAVMADVPVAAGVFGEIYFGKKAAARQSELQRRSNIRLANATEKAEEAQLARAKLEAQLAPRFLTKEQFEKFQALKGKLSVVNIASTTNTEAITYASQIAQALTNADIEVRVFPPRVGTTWTEIYVVIPKAVNDYSTVPLYQAFHSAGISVGCGDRTQNKMYEFPPDIPIILVGEKRGLNYPEIPYAFYFGRDSVTEIPVEVSGDNSNKTG